MSMHQNVIICHEKFIKSEMFKKFERNGHTLRFTVWAHCNVIYSRSIVTYSVKVKKAKLETKCSAIYA